MNSLLAAAIAAGVLCSMIKNANPYDAFLRGAGEGMALMLKTAPNIFAAALCAGMLKKAACLRFWRICWRRRLARWGCRRKSFRCFW
jgi:spore maturation protein SpmB